MRYTILIPCHNEAGSLRAVLERLRADFPGDECLVVDDGSTDGTLDVAASVSGVRVHRLEPNRGKGVALRTGFSLAHGDAILMIDGDGQDDPAEMRLLAAEIERGADFANGSKFIGTLVPGAISTPNYFGNRFMSGFINLLFRARVSDSQSGFRAVRAELIRTMNLRSVQYEIETEMLCQAIKRGARIVEVPVTRRPRSAGSTGFRRVRNGLRILFTILAERLRP
ncbi:MAG: glycosyltransferase family 2 protein [Deltaproteobacteria bacterium]|nr:glycosyltransferase family 2 protein [Deltaproteobacteria bacterium]